MKIHTTDDAAEDCGVKKLYDRMRLRALAGDRRRRRRSSRDCPAARELPAASVGNQRLELSSVQEGPNNAVRNSRPSVWT
ncbi:hypothetical protein Droror1_Dr00017274 [Drosera rotundifolia]